MWRPLTALVLAGLAACAPALAQNQALTGGTAVPDGLPEAVPEAVPELAPTGGLPSPPPEVEPAPTIDSQPLPEVEPETQNGPPAALPRPPEEEVPAVVALKPISELPVAQSAQLDDPLQDLPQVAPEAPEQEVPREEPPEEAAGPQLADTGLEALLLAWSGVALLSVGLTTLAILRNARRLHVRRR